MRWKAPSQLYIAFTLEEIKLIELTFSSPQILFVFHITVDLI